MQHTPMRERSCIGCGRKTGKAELLRFVRREDGTLLFDETQRESGRGGYFCPQESCFALAFKKRRLARRFHLEVHEDLASLLSRVRHRLPNSTDDRRDGVSIGDASPRQDPSGRIP